MNRVQCVFTFSSATLKNVADAVNTFTTEAGTRTATGGLNNALR